MHKIKLLIIAIAMLFLTGCGTTAQVAENYSDLTACGDFPTSMGDGGPSARFFVCRNIDTGDCYYKTSYFEQINGCDPKFSDSNPYGNNECFKSLLNVYDFNGNVVENESENYRPKDNCTNTEQNYFESKIKK
ncbi:MAG: hypothetical protein WC806_04035 [Candidatus Gracilibacteria bacterium]|jgi:hypothetical protein